MSTNPLGNPLDKERTTAPENKKDLYATGAGEIFTKNFLAGFARALGTVVVYLIFLTVLSFILANTLLPQLQTIIADLTKNLNSLTQPGSLNRQVGPQELQQLLNQVQR